MSDGKRLASPGRYFAGSAVRPEVDCGRLADDLVRQCELWFIGRDLETVPNVFSGLDRGSLSGSISSSIRSALCFGTADGCKTG
jgi:hypothetical protein